MADVTLLDLWLPIVLSAVVIFFASFLAWMVLPHHKKDWAGIPNEDAMLEAMRSNNVPPGQYMFPFCQSPAELKDPEKKKRYLAGPHGVLTVWPGPPGMGGKLVATFIFYLVVGLFVAYLASNTMNAGENYLHVFRITGTAAILAYVFGFIPGAIWFGRTPRSVMMDIIDGVVYGLLTAGIFGWLWPAADMPAIPGVTG